MQTPTSTSEDPSVADGYTVAPKGYFGPSSRQLPFINPNPFEDHIVDRSKLYLCECTCATCNQKETASYVSTERAPTLQEMLLGKTTIKETKLVVKSFPRCHLCLTRYCSKECQIKDWQHGLHKEKCRKFKMVKEHCEKTFCPKCWKVKWANISDSYAGNKPSTPVYNPCVKCYRKELTLEDAFSKEITSDPDISRIWFQ